MAVWWLTEAIPGGAEYRWFYTSEGNLKLVSYPVDACANRAFILRTRDWPQRTDAPAAEGRGQQAVSESFESVAAWLVNRHRSPAIRAASTRRAENRASGDVKTAGCRLCRTICGKVCMRTNGAGLHVEFAALYAVNHASAEKPGAPCKLFGARNAP